MYDARWLTNHALAKAKIHLVTNLMCHITEDLGAYFCKAKRSWTIRPCIELAIGEYLTWFLINSVKM